MNVHQNGVKSLSGNEIDSFGAILGKADIVTVPFQHLADKVPVDLNVLDNEDPQLHVMMRSWPSDPDDPFRIADRLYYVGSRELAAILIDSGNGLILLDAGMPEFAPRVLANIRALGFDPKQVKILLNSQAHLDHAGGLAAIKAATGARMLATAADAQLLERGGKGDFAWGTSSPTRPSRSTASFATVSG